MDDDDSKTDSNKVFISYRRRPATFFARLVYRDLKDYGFDPFMDVESLDSGEFPSKILHQIEARPHFVMCLTPGSLSGMEGADDWLRREFEHALEHERNIVPMLGQGFNFKDPEEERVLTSLPEDLGRLMDIQAIRVYDDYVDEGLSRLRTRFLRAPVEAKIAPTPPDEQAWERTVQAVASSAAQEAPPQPPQPVEPDTRVFIIHHRSDAAFARELAVQLQMNGLDPLIDLDDLNPGEAWDFQIERTLRDEVRYVVVLQSAALVGADEGYVFKEIRVALDRAEFFPPHVQYLIPAIIDDPKNMLSDLMHYQHVDLTAPDGVDRLVSVILRDVERSQKSS